MGFYSWKTQNTNRSISNVYSTRPTFPVAMVSDTGQVWFENYYEGYGVFGGKNYYALLAEMNGCVVNSADLADEPKKGRLAPTAEKEEKLRRMGLHLAFENHPNGDNPNCKHPILIEVTKEILSANSDIYGLFSAVVEAAKPFFENDSIPENCEFQGFFYENDEMVGDIFEFDTEEDD